MLKHRIIPVLLTDGQGQCVKPVAFERPYRKLGTMEQYIRVIESRNVDELIIIDINATREQRKPDFKKLRSWCDNLFCPVTYGGGIHTLDDIRIALENGADKVAIKSSFNLWENSAKKFGSQAIVGVFDYNQKEWVTYNDFLEPEINDVTRWYEDSGVGEILLTNIELDGVMEGYDLEIIKDVSEISNIPVIALGGCGEPIHMHQALDAGASAVAAGSIFLYTDYTPRDCAKFLDELGHAVRI